MNVTENRNRTAALDYLKWLWPTVSLMSTAFVFAALMTILTPLTTDRLDIVTRFLLWFSMCLLGGLGVLLADLFLRYFQVMANAGVSINVRAAGASMPVFLTLFIYGWGRSWLAGPTLFFYIYVIAVLITALSALLSRLSRFQNTQEITPSEAEPAVVEPPLFNKLPIQMRHGTLYAISSEDHYVKVHTSIGDYMLRSSLTNAISLTGNLSGVRTHRCWWIAENGIDKIKKWDGRKQVQLKSGICAPVSRNGARELRSLKWF
ncbi:MAG: LytTR family DNA-binding domain-containing protein [Pseudomonadota bacterium]